MIFFVNSGFQATTWQKSWSLAMPPTVLTWSLRSPLSSRATQPSNQSAARSQPRTWAQAVLSFTKRCAQITATTNKSNLPSGQSRLTFVETRRSSIRTKRQRLVSFSVAICRCHDSQIVICCSRSSRRRDWMIARLWAIATRSSTSRRCPLCHGPCRRITSILRLKFRVSVFFN